MPMVPYSRYRLGLYEGSVTTKGFIFVISDDWFSEKDSTSPLIERMMQLMDGTSAAWFQSWNVYGALYADGESSTLHDGIEWGDASVRLVSEPLG